MVAFTNRRGVLLMMAAALLIGLSIRATYGSTEQDNSPDGPSSPKQSGGNGDGNGNGDGGSGGDSGNGDGGSGGDSGNGNGNGDENGDGDGDGNGNGNSDGNGNRNGDGDGDGNGNGNGNGGDYGGDGGGNDGGDGGNDNDNGNGGGGDYDGGGGGNDNSNDNGNEGSSGQNSHGNHWCVANPSADPKALQVALDYACGIDDSICKSIQPGEACYQPNNLAAHASFAFNGYWKGRRDKHLKVTCDFGGTALISITDPGQGGCHYD
ncbi:hypothetical protein GOP47_0021228 [Adiantum capillus-veneris]|uniref:X8 domain-containing protein n=1 Tax=Adiantum capillus-veneris TaxID=13818 RepID=A0A9D4UAQ0_ADICA|nr:hypothetical protein GOP47_0021228 [Adiantum capillus-veneris]